MKKENQLVSKARFYLNVNYTTLLCSIMLYDFALQTQELVEKNCINNAVSLKININFKANSIISYKFSLKFLNL